MRAAIWAAHVLLGIGLCAPCMTVTPRAGPLEGLGRWLGLLQEPKTYSVVTGVLRLLTGGNVAVGILLLVFSVLFPVAKLVVLRAAEQGRAHDIAARFGRYSMADVFVLALMVVVSKSFPGGTTVEVRWGAFAFAAAALLCLVLASAISRRAAAGSPAPRTA
jgi:paraquat-inducible protein A